MSSITTYFKVVSPQSPNVSVSDNQSTTGGGNGLYGNYGWYQRIIQGSTTRLTRYREYDIMDNDIDVSRALDIMAEEMTGNNPKTRLPMDVMIEAGSEENIPSHHFSTLRAGLKAWTKLHNWQGGRLFSVARNMIKYGDCFFERNANKNKPFKFIHPKNVMGAIVSEDDITDIRGWWINGDYNDPSRTEQGSSAFQSQGTGNIGESNAKPLDKDNIVRFCISDDMTEEAPFGISVLRPAYKVFKQKELLEDSILIYRISRAPEKRVFYIDVGNRPDNLVPGILEKFRNQIKQKKVPSKYGGKSQTESIYNPQSINEDFYFATRPNGSGSKVETLPGGQGLGELTELDYFYRKMWRALRIPSSYIGSSTEDGQAMGNEGRVGIAYLQEIKFSLYIQRLQRYLEEVLDAEFKRWLYEAGIHIDPTIYRITLPEPSDYFKSKQQAMDADMLNNLSAVDGLEYISKRFALERYAGLTKDEIRLNEDMLRKEKGIQGTGDDRDLPLLYRPEDAEAGGFDGGMGGGAPFGGSAGGEGGEEGEEGGEDLGGGPEGPEGPEGPDGGEEESPEAGNEQPTTPEEEKPAPK